MAWFDPTKGQLVYPEGAPLTDVQRQALRYSWRQEGPATAYDTNWKNIGPRFGLAFRPKGSNDFVMRAGYGIFYAPASGFVTVYTTFVSPWMGRYPFNGTPASPVFIDRPLQYFNPAD